MIIFEKDILTLLDSTLTDKDKTFIIEGNLMEDELNDKWIILSFDENGDGNFVNASCHVNDKGSKKYELVSSSYKKNQSSFRMNNEKKIWQTFINFYGRCK